jgi:hypothetical protein
MGAGQQHKLSILQFRKYMSMDHNLPYQDEVIISWTELHRDAKFIAKHLLATGSWKGIIAITKGGLIPSALILCQRGLASSVISLDQLQDFIVVDRQGPGNNCDEIELGMQIKID